MKPTLSIKLKPKAYEDLDYIYLYSLNNFGKAKAIEYIEKINQAFIRIASNVASTQACDYIKPQLQKLTINSHVIFFNTHKDTIVVIRVLHQSQDFDKNIFKEQD